MGWLAAVVVARPAPAVHHHHPLSVLAAQQPIEGALRALLADQVSRAVGAAGQPQLPLRDLAQVAQGVGGERTVAVESDMADVDLELRMLEIGHREPGDLGEREVLGDQQGGEDRGSAVELDHLLQLAPGPAEDTGSELQARPQIAAAAAVEEEIVAGHVLHQQPIVAVEDQPARRLDRHLPEAVVLGQLAVEAALDHLHEPVGGADQHQQEDEGHPQARDPLQQVFAMLPDVHHLETPGSGLTAAAPAGSPATGPSAGGPSGCRPSAPTPASRSRKP